MIQHEKRCIQSPGKSWFYRSYVWAWGAVIVSIVVCFLVAWMHIQAQRMLDQFRVNLEDVRQARIELNQGFLQFLLGDTATGPFDSATGLALLSQSVESFDATLASLKEVDKSSLEKFRTSVAEFRRQLTAWRKGGAARDSEQMVALRVAFASLERQTDIIDREAHRHLQLASDQLDRRFIFVATGAALALAFLCVLVFYAGRTRDRLEEDAKMIAARFQEAMDVTQDGVWEWDIPHDTLYQSPGCWRMLGYTNESGRWPRTSLFDLIHPDDFDDVAAATQRCVKNEEAAFEMEFRVKAVDATWKWVLSRGKITQRDSAGIALRMLGTSVDITERKKSAEEREKLREQLMQSQKMESIGRLAGGVAHDFNNMLQGILGFSELLELDTADQPVLHDHALEICKTVRRAQNLTRQLLAFSREQTYTPILANLYERLIVSQKMLQRIVSEVRIVVQPSPGLFLVKVDVGQFEQVVMNLVVNARDAIADLQQGVIEIAAENVEVTAAECMGCVAWRPGTFVRLSVRDNGVGIAPELHARIFEPFYTTKQRERGTGLGLSVVYGIMKQHGGWVDVRGGVGQGSTFDLYFPAVRDAEVIFTERDEQTFDARSFQGKGETVLVVEDEHVVLRMIEKVFSGCGYRVLCATSASEGWALFGAHGRDIGALFSDVILPDGNGLDLADRMRKQIPDLPVILCSGYTRDSLNGSVLEEHRYRFLEKPYTRIQALALLHEVMHDVVQDHAREKGNDEVSPCRSTMLADAAPGHSQQSRGE